MQSKINEAKKLGLVLPQDAGITAADLRKSDPKRAEELAKFIAANMRALVGEIAGKL